MLSKEEVKQRYLENLAIYHNCLVVKPNHPSNADIEKICNVWFEMLMRF